MRPTRKQVDFLFLSLRLLSRFDLISLALIWTLIIRNLLYDTLYGLLPVRIAQWYFLGIPEREDFLFRQILIRFIYLLLLPRVKRPIKRGDKKSYLVGGFCLF